MRHKDKVAIVTGASMGIGRAISVILAREGCHVVCAARSLEKLSDTASKVEKLGRKALAVKTDVSKTEDVANMIDTAMKEFGRIDILVNNAGGPTASVLSPQPESQDEFFSTMERFTLLNITDDDFQSIVNVNFHGAYNCIKHTLPVMIKQGKGDIVNITSKSGMFKNDVVPGMIAYASSKAALSRFTEVLSFELMCAGINVRVNAISPGMVAVSFHEKLPPEEVEGFRKPEDIESILLQILDESSTVSGEIFNAETLKTWDEEMKEGV